MVEYKYGMRLRGFSIGCQPMRGFLRREDDETGNWYDIIVYDRKLDADEVYSYDLDEIPTLTMSMTGIKVITPYEWEWDRYKVAVSKLSVLVYINDRHVGTFFHSKDWTPKDVAEMIQHWAKDMPEEAATEIGRGVLDTVVFE